MARIFAVAVATAVSLLLLHPGPCAAVRTLTSRPASSETAALEVAQSQAPAPEAARWGGGAAARAAKYMWLPPFGGRGNIGAAAAGAHYFPGWYPSSGKPMLWAARGGATPAAWGVFRARGQLVQAPPHDDEDLTRQEQVALWASLLRPSHRPTTSLLPSPARGDAADGEPEPEPSVSDEGAEAVDVPAGGGSLIGQPAGGLEGHWP